MSGLAADRRRQRWLYSTGSAATVVIVLGILIFLALLGERYSWRWDLTADKSQSLSQVTRNILAELTGPLKLTAFLPEGQLERQQAKELLENYQLGSRWISVSIVDPERQPLEAQQAGYRMPGNVLVEYQGRRQLANSTTEEDLTNAIRKVLKPQSKKVYFLTGHGERSLQEGAQHGYTQARQALINQGLEVAELNLLTQPQVPADAAALIVAGPEKPLFPPEIKALSDYLQRGGRVLLLLEPYRDAGLKDLLAGYGLELDDRLILDDNQVSRALGASVTMPLVINYGHHRITQDFTNIVTIFPSARPLYLAAKPPAGIQLTPLATTTKTSWAKAGQEWLKTGQVGFVEGQDRRGPFHVAVLASKDLKTPEPKNQERAAGSEAPAPEPEKKAYLVVVGDTDFADNRYFNLSGNGDLFLNMVNYLAGEESQIAVRREEKKAQPLILRGYQGLLLLVLCLVVLPLGMVLAGVNAYLRRRSRR